MSGNQFLAPPGAEILPPSTFSQQQSNNNNNNDIIVNNQQLAPPNTTAIPHTLSGTLKQPRKPYTNNNAIPEQIGSYDTTDELYDPFKNNPSIDQINNNDINTNINANSNPTNNPQYQQNTTYLEYPSERQQIQPTTDLWGHPDSDNEEHDKNLIFGGFYRKAATNSRDMTQPAWQNPKINIVYMASDFDHIVPTIGGDTFHRISKTVFGARPGGQIMGHICTLYTLFILLVVFCAGLSVFIYQRQDSPIYSWLASDSGNTGFTGFQESRVQNEWMTHYLHGDFTLQHLPLTKGGDGYFPHAQPQFEKPFGPDLNISSPLPFITATTHAYQRRLVQGIHDTPKGALLRHKTDAHEIVLSKHTEQQQPQQQQEIKNNNGNNNNENDNNQPQYNNKYDYFHDRTFFVLKPAYTLASYTMPFTLWLESFVTHNYYNFIGYKVLDLFNLFQLDWLLPRDWVDMVYNNVPRVMSPNSMTLFGDKSYYDEKTKRETYIQATTFLSNFLTIPIVYIVLLIAFVVFVTCIFIHIAHESYLAQHPNFITLQAMMLISLHSCFIITYKYYAYTSTLLQVYMIVMPFVFVLYWQLMNIAFSCFPDMTMVYKSLPHHIVVFIVHFIYILSAWLLAWDLTRGDWITVGVVWLLPIFTMMYYIMGIKQTFESLSKQQQDYIVLSQQEDDVPVSPLKAQQQAIANSTSPSTSNSSNNNNNTNSTTTNKRHFINKKRYLTPEAVFPLPPTTFAIQRMISTTHIALATLCILLLASAIGITYIYIALSVAAFIAIITTYDIAATPVPTQKTRVPQWFFDLGLDPLDLFGLEPNQWRKVEDWEENDLQIVPDRKILRARRIEKGIIPDDQDVEAGMTEDEIKMRRKMQRLGGMGMLGATGSGGGSTHNNSRGNNSFDPRAIELKAQFMEQNKNASIASKRSTNTDQQGNVGEYKNKKGVMYQSLNTNNNQTDLQHDDSDIFATDYSDSDIQNGIGLNDHRPYPPPPQLPTIYSNNNSNNNQVRDNNNNNNDIELQSTTTMTTAPTPTPNMKTILTTTTSPQQQQQHHKKNTKSVQINDNDDINQLQQDSIDEFDSSDDDSDSDDYSAYRQVMRQARRNRLSDQQENNNNDDDDNEEQQDDGEDTMPDMMRYLLDNRSSNINPCGDDLPQRQRSNNNRNNNRYNTLAIATNNYNNSASGGLNNNNNNQVYPFKQTTKCQCTKITIFIYTFLFILFSLFITSGQFGLRKPYYDQDYASLPPIYALHPEVEQALENLYQDTRIFNGWSNLGSGCFGKTSLAPQEVINKGNSFKYQDETNNNNNIQQQEQEQQPQQALKPLYLDMTDVAYYTRNDVEKTLLTNMFYENVGITNQYWDQNERVFAFNEKNSISTIDEQIVKTIKLSIIPSSSTNGGRKWHQQQYIEKDNIQEQIEQQKQQQQQTSFQALTIPLQDSSNSSPNPEDDIIDIDNRNDLTNPQLMTLLYHIVNTNTKLPIDVTPEYNHTPRSTTKTNPDGSQTTSHVYDDDTDISTYDKSDKISLVIPFNLVAGLFKANLHSERILPLELPRKLKWHTFSSVSSVDEFFVQCSSNNNEDEEKQSNVVKHIPIYLISYLSCENHLTQVVAINAYLHDIVQCTKKQIVGNNNNKDDADNNKNHNNDGDDKKIDNTDQDKPRIDDEKNNKNNEDENKPIIDNDLVDNNNNNNNNQIDHDLASILEHDGNIDNTQNDAVIDEDKLPAQGDDVLPAIWFKNKPVRHTVNFLLSHFDEMQYMRTTPLPKPFQDAVHNANRYFSASLIMTWCLFWLVIVGVIWSAVYYRPTLKYVE